MKSFKPIKKPVARRWFYVKFSYEYMRTVPRYDADADDLVDTEVRTGPDERIVRQLAESGEAAAVLVAASAAQLVTVGTEKRTPIEGTVVILGVEEWEPLAKSKEVSWL